MTPETLDLVRVPRSLEDLGLPESLVVDLVLRRTMADGKTSIGRLSSSLCLNHSLTESVVIILREKKLVEFEGMVGRDYVIVLTDAGKALASERTQSCAYAGVAPVPLDLYEKVVKAQQPQLEVNRASLQRSFADLVIDPGLIDELGPAMMSRGAIFLYGPPGTGKSSIAERMIRAYGDLVVVPRAVEVDGQIIMVFDPTVHSPAPEQPSDIDKRWVLCERPCVIGGGELVPQMLDLSFDSKSGIYLAPLQMKANNGMFVVDDFGRQSMSPAQLLNRWIVPLDRRIDYLSLVTGVKFEVPFNVKVIFSTNLPPSALGDEAFFRRLQSKVYIGSIQDSGFDEVLRRVATARGIAYTDDDAAYLRHLTRTRGDGDLRPYVPSMVCEILGMICRYEDRPVAMSRATLDRVAEIYFTNLTGDPAKPMSSVALSDGTMTSAPIATPPAGAAPPAEVAPVTAPPIAAAPVAAAHAGTSLFDRPAPVERAPFGTRESMPALEVSAEELRAELDDLEEAERLAALRTSSDSPSASWETWDSRGTSF